MTHTNPNHRRRPTPGPSEGNLDIVGTNKPVFFIRDPLKIQHLINADGERYWVTYHFATDQGIEFLIQEEGDRLAGEDGDYHQRDLYEAIERGDFPSWMLKMQIMPFDDATTYRFNPLDLTKVWPHGDYPLIEVGTLTLDRNVTDYHTEIEQAAFQPNNAVPGTGLSPDKMVLARGFAYADAHRARLGVNYQQIPVNRPHAPVRSYSKDGAMRIDNVTDPMYAPNSIEGAPAADIRAYAEHAVWGADGEMTRAPYTLHADDDDVRQPRALINEVMDDAARDRLVANVAGHVAKCKRPDVVERVFEYWRTIDTAIGNRIEAAVLSQPT